MGESRNGSPMKKIILLRPRGFCAGVVRAIDVVKIVLNLYGAPVYVRKEIVHNRHVVDELRQAGAIFVEELSEVPEGARVIFSAHGVSPAVRKEAKERKLEVIDATCPLVTKVHLEAVRFARQDHTIVLIGHAGHDEVIGTLGEAPESTVLVSSVEDVDKLEVKDPSRISFLTQTTLSLDETKDIVQRLKERFPAIKGPKTQDICYATENRQLGVKAVVPLTDVLLVVGSQNSSNSRRLVEVCENEGVPAYLVDDSTEVNPAWLDGTQTVAVTAGASAPENLVQELIQSLETKFGFDYMEEMELKEEDVRFHLPADLEAIGAEADYYRSRMSPKLQVAGTLVEGAAQAARRATEYLTGIQSEQGYWWAELTADTTLGSDYILLQLWLHPPVHGVWNPPTRELIGKAAESILARQLSDGGFNIYPQGPTDLSATVKAYFALKLAGLDYNDLRLTRARERILSLGGIQAANSYVKINLSLFDLFPRDHAPSIPPEMVLFGNFIYEMSSWTRAIVIPLSIVHALNPRRPVPAGFNLQELFVADGQQLEFRRDRTSFTWRNVFLRIDKILKLWEKHGSKAIRQRAIRKAGEWMLEHARHTDGVAAIYPPMMYVIMALDLLGHAPDSPEAIGSAAPV